MYSKNLSSEKVGLISNIQRYTIHDGPGIRTEIFFVGCTLKCIWCSNPETILPRQRLGVFPAKCLSLSKCGYCTKVCPLTNNGTSMFPIAHDENGVLSSIRMQEKCADCLKCAECPSRAIKIWGEYMTQDELMDIIVDDRSFYRKTGGGVTLSGGEVMMQWEFALGLLKSCKNASINTCVETALHCQWEQANAVFEYTDLIITDIKHMDSQKHKDITGSGNELILDNIIKASKLGIKMVIRTPIVPGYNDDLDNIRETGTFIRDELGTSVIQYQLLPYKKIGTEKYASLGEPYPMGDYLPLERSIWENNIKELTKVLVSEYGVPAVAGSNQKLKI